MKSPYFHDEEMGLFIALPFKNLQFIGGNLFKCHIKLHSREYCSLCAAYCLVIQLT